MAQQPLPATIHWKQHVYEHLHDNLGRHIQHAVVQTAHPLQMQLLSASAAAHLQAATPLTERPSKNSMYMQLLLNTAGTSREQPASQQT
jgi:hypothetical protein